MPLDEQGAKWSCEPCIRGHRSSKCQHFDRLMMKVPKAGRPLAKCPHPKGSCSCQRVCAMMVRIPKGSSCLCRPVYSLPVDGDEPAQSSGPTPIAAAPGKIQKSSRKSSILQTAPENIAKALEAMSNLDNSQHTNGTSDSLPSTSVVKSEFNPYTSLDSGFNGYMAQQAPDTRDTPPAPQKGSCCSKKPEPPKPASPRKGSCCGKRNSTLENGARTGSRGNDTTSSNGHDLNNGMGHPALSAPQVSSWQDYNAAGYGDLTQPFDVHPMLAQSPSYVPTFLPNTTPNTQSVGYQHQGIPQELGFPQAAMSTGLNQNSQQFGYHHPSPPLKDPNHDCSCGDNCQCYGCLSHPYNNTTIQHVQEMGLLVAFDDGKQSPGRITSRQSLSFPGQENGTSMAYTFPDFTNHLNNDVPSNTMHQYPDQTSYSNIPKNGYSSPPDFNQQLMESDEYITFPYNVQLPSSCSDMSGTCQCGNDCTCIGCLTHNGHNGVPAAPPVTTAENPSVETAQSPWSPSMQSGLGLSRIPVLDNLPVSSSSPHAVEP